MTIKRANLPQKLWCKIAVKISGKQPQAQLSYVKRHSQFSKQEFHKNQAYVMPVVLGWWEIFIVTKFDIIIPVALSDMNFGHINTIDSIKYILKTQSLTYFKLLFPDRWEQQTSYIYSLFHLCLLKFSLFNIWCIPGDNAGTFTFGRKV